MNSITLTGRLANDPEVIYAPSGTAVTKFRLAENKYVAKTKEKQAQFVPCVSFGKLGEIMGNNLKKGQKIVATGELRITNYVNKDGEKRTYTQVVIRQFDFADSKNQQVAENKKKAS